MKQNLSPKRFCILKTSSEDTKNIIRDKGNSKISVVPLPLITDIFPLMMFLINESA